MRTYLHMSEVYFIIAPIRQFVRSFELSGSNFQKNLQTVFRQTRLWLNVVIGLFLSSCSLKIYSPNQQFVPALKQTGDVELQGGLGVTEELQFTEVSFAMAVHQDWALIAKGSYAQDKRETNSSRTGYGYLGETALARSWWIASNVMVQLQASAGFGRQYHLSDLSGSTSFKWNRYFLQTAFKYYGQLLEITMSSRFGQLQFGRELYALDYPKPEGMPTLREQLPNRQLWLFEPALTLGLGYKNIKFYTQACYAIYSRRFPAEDVYFGLGLTVRLPSRRSE